MTPESLILKRPGFAGAEISLSNANTLDATSTAFNGTNQYLTTPFSTRRNLIPNPSFETGTTGYGTNAATLAQSVTQAWDGTYSARLTATGPNSALMITGGSRIAAAATVQYTASYYLFNTVANRRGCAAIGFYDGGGTIIGAFYFGTNTAPTVNTWTRFSVTATAPAGTASAALFLYSDFLSAGSASEVSYIDGVLFEPSAAAGAYFPTPAQLASGEAAFSGTAHASFSEIGAFVNNAKRTFMFWLQRDTAVSQCTIANQLAGAGQFDIVGQFTGSAFTICGSGTTVAAFSGVPTDTLWHHYAIVYDRPNAKARCYVDGVLTGGEQTLSGTWYGGTTAGQTVQIGRYAGGQYVDGTMRGISIHRTALTADVIGRCASAKDYDWHVLNVAGWLSAFWPLNATSGFAETSGNGYTASAANGVVAGGVATGPWKPDWTTESLDLANPEPRDEYLVGSDADGSLPARVPRLENRQVSVRLRATDTGTMDGVLANVGAVAETLQLAKETAAAGVVDPVDYVRLVYTPKDSTKSYFLPVYGGSIGDIPRTLDGTDAGFFNRVPVVNLSLACGPAGFGDLRTYLATTATTLGPAPSLTVPGGPGDLPPWARFKFADNASKLRGRLSAGIRQGESATTAEIGIGAMTLIAGTNVGGYVSPGVSLSDWTTMASLPTQSRTGTFRVYATRAFGPPPAKLRLTWAEAGASRRTMDSVAVPAAGAGYADAYLGEINPSSTWNAWIEAIGWPAFYYILLVPTDSFVEAVGPAGGLNLRGPIISTDDLRSASTHISGRALATGGSWTTAGQKTAPNTWPVTTTSAERGQVSMSAAGFAIAGTLNTLDVHAEAVIRRGAASAAWTADLTKPYSGVFIRYFDISNFLVAGYAVTGATTHRLIVSACVGGTYYPLWVSNTNYTAGTTWTWKVELEATSDGRWSARFRTWDHTNNVPQPSGYVEEKASGYHGLLVAGEALGAATARTGLFDYIPTADVFGMNWTYFRANTLAGLTPPPIPSGSNLTLAGPEMVTANGGKYPYAGASGLTLKPNANNNLTIAARRSAGDAGLVTIAETDSLNVTIDGYPRYSSIPY